MTTDTTLHHDVRKLLTAIRHDLGKCAQAMQTAAAIMRKASHQKEQ